MVVLSLGDNENLKPPVMLLDTVIQRDEVGKLEQEVASLPSVGFIKDGPWKFGFVHKPPFSFFSASGFCCQLRHVSLEKPYLRICGESLYEDIPLSNIEHVKVSLSPEPWEERKLQLKMKDGDVVSVVEDSEENISRDHTCRLASLMISTEWMVKCAGHLCIATRQFGQTSISLTLPSVLTADVNPSVAMRNKL